MHFPFILPANKEFDAVGFGTNAVDYLIRVPQYPAFNSKIHLTDYVQAAGGEVATAMVGLRRLGLKTAYAGRFGMDREGDYGLESLREEGVNADFAERVPGAKTQTAFIIIDERNGERTVIWHRDEKLKYAEPDAPVEIAALGKVFHFTPHDAAACLKMARAAKQAGAIVSIDIDDVFEGMENLLPLVDVLISSQDFPLKLFGKIGDREALAGIKSRFGCPVVGMTLGESGSLIFCRETFIETGGFPVPAGCRDTTGAGDSFRAGFLYGLLSGETVETSARMANAVAALKCRAVGARTSLPNNFELNKMLT